MKNKKNLTNELNRVVKYTLWFVPPLILFLNFLYVEVLGNNIGWEGLGLLFWVYPIITVIITVLIATVSGFFSQVKNKVWVFAKIIIFSITSYVAWTIVWIMLIQEVLEQILY